MQMLDLVNQRQKIMGTEEISDTPTHRSVHGNWQIRELTKPAFLDWIEFFNQGVGFSSKQWRTKYIQFSFGSNP